MSAPSKSASGRQPQRLAPGEGQQAGRQLGTALDAGQPAVLRGYLLTDDPKAPEGFGVDEAVYTFGKASEANAMVKTLKKVFLVHGEPMQAEALAKMIRTFYDLPVEIPQRGQAFDL